MSHAGQVKVKVYAGSTGSHRQSVLAQGFIKREHNCILVSNDPGELIDMMARFRGECCSIFKGFTVGACTMQKLLSCMTYVLCIIDYLPACHLEDGFCLCLSTAISLSHCLQKCKSFSALAMPLFGCCTPLMRRLRLRSGAQPQSKSKGGESV